MIKLADRSCSKFGLDQDKRFCSSRTKLDSMSEALSQPSGWSLVLYPIDANQNQGDILRNDQEVVYHDLSRGVYVVAGYVMIDLQLDSGGHFLMKGPSKPSHSRARECR